MNKITVLIMLLLSVFFNSPLKAEGLPANPWQKQTNLNVSVNNANDDIASTQAIKAAADIWHRVRNTNDFRQWKMPETQSNNSQSAQNSTDNNEQQNLLSLLANLNRVGYQLPSDYKNIVKQMPKRSNAQSKASYERSLRQWQSKYQGFKNNSLNVLNNSYHRVLSTIRNSTGLDINRAINDSVNAFK